MTTKKKQDAAKLILTNALDFLNAGVRVLFVQRAAQRDAKVGVVLIQTAIELLSKYRLVKDGGLSTIVRGTIPKGDLIESAASGSLKTIGYSESLREIQQTEVFDETDRELFGRVQYLRNSLVHFTAKVDVELVRMEVAWLLIRVLAIFAAGQERDQGEMQTQDRFLEPSNFKRLTSFEPYRAESVDCAIDGSEEGAVRRCWACGVDALTVRHSGTYFCYCCGLTADIHMATFATCAICGQDDGVCFDPLNQTRGVYHGRCLHCETFVEVVVCKCCGSANGLRPGSVSLQKCCTNG